MIKTIVVEDENRIREGFIRMIDWSGYGIEIIATARNGKDGLRLIESLKPDLVFVDIKMPVMNGFEMLERSGHEYDAVIVSGYDEFSYAQKAIQYRVFDYLLKPVDPLALSELLKRYRRFYDGKERLAVLEDYLDEFLKIPKNSQNPLLRKSLKIIEKDLREDLSAEEMAHSLSISYSKLNMIYQEETGRTYRQFLVRYRIRKAMYLLSETDLLAYEIAESVGYTDYKYFSDVFKKQTSRTLTDYREHIRKDLKI